MDDRYRTRRSPDRGVPARGPPVDSYVPGSRIRSRSPPLYRRRSRSPPRLQADTWTPRARSPPPRYHDSRDSYTTRSQRRGYSPSGDRYVGRARSPMARRGRDVAPQPTGPRSPQTQGRERLPSPPRRNYERSPPRRVRSPLHDRMAYRPRSRSPPRREEYFASSKTWRRRSPSAGRQTYRPDGSGQTSTSASRRSSPPPAPRHPPPVSEYDPPRTRRQSPDHNSHAYREAVPSRSARSPHHEPARRAPEAVDEYSRHRDEHHATQQSYGAEGTPQMEGLPGRESFQRNQGPLAPRSPRNSFAPPPPTGPASEGVVRGGTAQAPPVGPASLARNPSSSYRGGRGGAPARDYPPRDFLGPRGGGRGGASRQLPAAGGFGRGGLPFRSGDNYPLRDPQAPREQYDVRSGPAIRGRDMHYGGFRGGHGGSSNSTSSTYPRTQRFNVGATLSDLPKINPEGERLPPLLDTSKADRLEEEAARLRKLIDDKAGERRRSLREWDRMSTAVKAAGERSDVVEQELRLITGEGLSGVAF